MDLYKITSQFMCCFPLTKIKWGNTLNNLSWNDQIDFIEKTIFHPIIIKFPLDKKYQMAFLKHVINILEKNNEEVHDKFYESYCHCINQPDIDWSYKHYKVVCNEFISLKESTKLISNGTTGLISWQASIALSEWALKNKSTFENKEILELGSGAGLMGFIIGKFCMVKKMFLSDCHGKVLNLLKENISLNFPSLNFEQITDMSFLHQSENDHDPTLGILNLPWETFNETELSELILPDIILAADVVYDDTLFEYLISAINKIFNLKRNQKCQLIMALTVRNEITLEKFMRLLDVNAFFVTDLEYYSPEIFIWDESIPIKIISVQKSIECS